MPYCNIVDLSQDPSSEIESLSSENHQLYEQFSERYSFTLDYFQKYSVVRLLNGHNVLITVPTSSGKTVIAEFGIFMGLKKQQKIIYTSPIKTLSNQKFSEFKDKFGSESVGIITGDVKFNPEAPCLIVTTEILREYLLKCDPIIDSVGVVIFDEVHYINNDDRGHVWEQCLMMLPANIKLIMLSATISHPELFAKWIGDIKKNPISLMVHTKRPVPLNHYLLSDSKLLLYSDGHTFHTQLYQNFYQEFKPVLNEKSTINGLVNYLNVNDLCPALMFTFSRSKCEQLAESLMCCFHESEKQCIIDKEIDMLLHRYQYDHKTIKLIPQVQNIRRLAIKGICYHHSGLLPFCKEIVEILFGKGYIKVMFVTETFSVGINMPTRTVVFTDLTKNTNGHHRSLYTDEYFQMAGRAGRRGLDTKGTVIYYPIRRITSPIDIRRMVDGQPMSIKSRYQHNYLTILQQLSNNIPYESIQNSYHFQEIERLMSQIQLDLVATQNQQAEVKRQLCESIDPDKQQLLIKWATVSMEPDEPQVIGDFTIKPDQKMIKKLKQEKMQFKKQLMTSGLMDNKDRILPQYQQYVNNNKKYQQLLKTEAQLQHNLDAPTKSLESKYNNKLWILEKCGFIQNMKLTNSGILAANINTTDGILISKLLDDKSVHQLSTLNLGLILSILTADCSNKDGKTLDDFELFKTNSQFINAFYNLKQINEYMSSDLDGYQSIELPLDLIESTHSWLIGKKYLEISGQLGDLEGNFVRSMVRLIRLCEELIKAINIINCYLSLEIKLREIIILINRDIVVFDSVYIK